MVEDGGHSGGCLIEVYTRSGICPLSLGVLREDDPVAYKRAYRKEYARRNKEALRRKAAEKYAETNRERKAQRLEERERKKEEAQRLKEGAQRLKEVRKAAREFVRELDAPERARRRRIRVREYARRRRLEGKALHRDKRARPAAWANQAAMAKVFLEARRLTKITGEEHHVDHIYPLLSPLVCGLHTEANLRAVPSRINLEKGNSLPGCCAEELWDPLSSDVYYDGDLYTQNQRKELEEAARKEAARLEAKRAAEERRQQRKQGKAAAPPAEKKRRGRKPMTAEAAASRPDVQALLSGESVRSVVRTYGVNGVNVVRYARLVDPNYKSPFHKHGRPQGART